MPCGNAATLIVISPHAERGEPLCAECVRYRHMGAHDFGILGDAPRGATCACTHMPAKLEQDRAHPPTFTKWPPFTREPSWY